MKSIYFISYLDNDAYGFNTFKSVFQNCALSDPDFSFTDIIITSAIRNHCHKIRYNDTTDCKNTIYIDSNLEFAFSNLNETNIISDSPDNIFIWNSTPAYSAIRSIQYYFPKSKIVYIIHDLIWLTYFKGNVQGFIDYLLKPEYISTSIGGKPRIFFQALYMDTVKSIQIADMTVSLNPETQQVLKHFFKADTNKITTIRNGLPLFLSPKCDKIQPSTRQTSNNPITLLYTGRCTVEKGFMTLLDAVAILLRLKTDVRIICCGDSSDIKISIPLNVKEYFDLRGVISRPEIFQIMEECDLGIVPSLFEQSGYSAIEMLRFGLPCIVSDGFGINDIASGGAAITFQCGNPQSLADEILTFIRLSDNAKKRMSDNAKYDFERRYTARRMWQDYRRIFTRF